jgi:hypothetical protein
LPTYGRGKSEKVEHSALVGRYAGGCGAPDFSRTDNECGGDIAHYRKSRIQSVEMKKKQKNLLMAIALSGASAYFLRTFAFGDTLIGAAIGGAVAGKEGALAGAIAGAVVPSAPKEFAVFESVPGLAGFDPFGAGGEPDPMMAPNGAETSGAM